MRETGEPAGNRTRAHGFADHAPLQRSGSKEGEQRGERGDAVAGTELQSG
jgi:hypothetical protein